MKKKVVATLVAIGAVAGVIGGVAAPAMAWNNVYYDGSNQCDTSSASPNVKLTTTNTYDLVHQIADWSGGYTSFNYNSGSAVAVHASRVGISYSPWATTGYNGAMSYYWWHCGN